MKRALLALALGFTALSAMPAPSTFGPVVGSALLCRDDIDHAWFRAYLSKNFGPSYKHEGGAYWYRAEGTLWGTPVREVMVGDDSSDLKFIAAVADATPEEFNDKIRAAAGVRHWKTGASRYAVLESSAGSRIAYAQNRSKIYCAKSAPRLPGS